MRVEVCVPVPGAETEDRKTEHLRLSLIRTRSEQPGERSCGRQRQLFCFGSPRPGEVPQRDREGERFSLLLPGAGLRGNSPAEIASTEILGYSGQKAADQRVEPPAFPSPSALHMYLMRTSRTRPLSPHLTTLATTTWALDPRLA